VNNKIHTGMTYLALRAATTLALAALGGGTAHADSNVPAPGTIRDEHVMIVKSTGLFGTKLSTYIFTPPGNGPFPLVIINHGKAPGNPHLQKETDYFWQSLELVKRGYAVISPTRSGFGSSGGNHNDPGSNLAAAARAWADDVDVTVSYAKTLPFIDPNHIVIIGQSEGGLVTVAYGERRTPGVLGLINIVGGLRSSKPGWESNDLNAFRSFGAKTGSLPVLFFYGTNDSHWGDGTNSREWFAAYQEGNPAAQYYDFGNFGSDAHALWKTRSSQPTWIPVFGKFITSLGLSWGLKYQLVCNDNEANDADDEDALKECRGDIAARATQVTQNQ